MLTNLLFVFGLSCLIGGLQWQVQELRITSGNVSIGMLLTATMGLVLPAALKLGNESLNSDSNGVSAEGTYELTPSDVNLSRVNALVMVIGYICYLIFQLGSHKEEFDYDGDEYAAFGGGHNIVRTPHYNSLGHLTNPKKPATRRNVFCKRFCFLMKYCPSVKEVEGGPLQKMDSFYEDGVEIQIMPNDEREKVALKRNTKTDPVGHTDQMSRLELNPIPQDRQLPPNGDGTKHDIGLRVQQAGHYSLKDHCSDKDDEDEGN